MSKFKSIMQQNVDEKFVYFSNKYLEARTIALGKIEATERLKQLTEQREFDPKRIVVGSEDIQAELIDLFVEDMDPGDWNSLEKFHTDIESIVVSESGNEAYQPQTQLPIRSVNPAPIDDPEESDDEELEEAPEENKIYGRACIFGTMAQALQKLKDCNFNREAYAVLRLSDICDKYLEYLKKITDNYEPNPSSVGEIDAIKKLHAMTKCRDTLQTKKACQSKLTDFNNEFIKQRAVIEKKRDTSDWYFINAIKNIVSYCMEKILSKQSYFKSKGAELVAEKEKISPSPMEEGFQLVEPIKDADENPNYSIN